MTFNRQHSVKDTHLILSKLFAKHLDDCYESKLCLNNCKCQKLAQNPGNTYIFANLAY